VGIAGSILFDDVPGKECMCFRDFETSWEQTW